MAKYGNKNVPMANKIPYMSFTFKALFLISWILVPQWMRIADHDVRCLDHRINFLAHG